MKDDIGALVIVTSATDTPVTRTDAKAWLKIESTDTADDSIVDQLLAMAATRYERFTKRAPLKQVYDWYLDASALPKSGGSLSLPRWPLVSVASVRGFGTTEGTDTGGTSMSTGDMYTDVATEPGRLIPVSGITWPTATRTINAMIVRFTAGHSTGSTGVPDSVREQMLRMVASAYEHRGDELATQELAMDAALRNDEFDLPEWG